MKSVIVRHSVKPTDGDVACRIAALQELMSTSGTVEVTAQQAERLAIESCFRRLGRAMIGRVQVTECRLVRSAESARTIGLDIVAINVIEAGGFKGYCGQRRMQTEAGSACLTLLSSPADYWWRDITWTAIVVSRDIFEREVGPVARYDGKVFAPGSLHAVILDAHIRAMLALPDRWTRVYLSSLQHVEVALVPRHESDKGDRQRNPAASAERRTSRDRLAGVVRRSSRPHRATMGLSARSKLSPRLPARFRLFSDITSGQSGIGSQANAPRQRLHHRGLVESAVEPRAQPPSGATA